MAESFVQTNVPRTLGKKLKTFESVDTGGNVVESEAVVLVDGDGTEIGPATETTLAQIAISVEVAGAVQTGAEFDVPRNLTRCACERSAQSSA